MMNGWHRPPCHGVSRSPLSSPSTLSGRSQMGDYADVLDENARLWRRVHALQERTHDMCVENVELRRQLSTLRARSTATAPLSLDLSFCQVEQRSPLPRSPVLQTPHAAVPPTKSPACIAQDVHQMKEDIERLNSDNAQLLSAAAEARTTIRLLRRQLERQRRCSCRQTLHRRSSSNGSNTLSAASAGENDHIQSRRKWDWERREESYTSLPDLVHRHVRTPSVPSLV
ncbi:unnamed protein product [Cutaneotrichosporon oleaginosum]